MIHEVVNIELCELLDMEPKTQCTVCLSYWDIGIVYCTFPEYVIKNGRPHGHRYGKKPRDKEYYLANQLKKICEKRQFQRIHDRFLRDREFRVRMIEHNRDEEVCRRWDALADEDHTHHLTAQEYLHHKSKWWLHSN